MKHQNDLFNAGVNDMRLWFTSSTHEKYLFSKNHFAKAVPAADFGQYASDIWSQIRCHKELNLPSQKEMIANFRCEEVFVFRAQILYGSFFKNPLLYFEMIQYCYMNLNVSFWFLYF